MMGFAGKLLLVCHLRVKPRPKGQDFAAQQKKQDFESAGSTVKVLPCSPPREEKFFMAGKIGSAKV